MDKPTIGAEKVDVSSSAERGKQCIMRGLNAGKPCHKKVLIAIILEVLESDGAGENDTHISTCEMGIQADFSDDEGDIDSYSSEGDLVIDENDGMQTSTDSKVRSTSSQHSMPTEGEATQTARKAIELKYIYGEDLSKSDIERREFSVYIT